MPRAESRPAKFHAISIYSLIAAIAMTFILIYRARCAGSAPYAGSGSARAPRGLSFTNPLVAGTTRLEIPNQVLVTLDSAGAPKS